MTYHMRRRMQILSMKMKKFSAQSSPFRGSVSTTVTTIILLILLFQGYSVQAQALPEDDEVPDECIPPGGQLGECTENLSTPKLNVTVLLPFDPYYKASMKRVGQAIYLGFQKVRELEMLPGHQVILNYENSNCSNVIAPIKFMKNVFNSARNVNVFFGPTCDLALAPVARSLKYFNKILLTAGGLSLDYTENKTVFEKEFFLTTRTGVGFKEIVDFILQYFERFHWKNAMLMYDKEDMSEVSGLHTCKFFMSTLAEYMKENKWPFGNFDLRTNNVNASVKEILAEELGLKYSDVFLGPMCDYVIAPVARYAGHWGIPVLTAGAQAEAFRHKHYQYSTLTRLAGSYSLVGEGFYKILALFGWRHVALFYHNFAVGSGKGHSLCHFTLGTVFTALNSTPVYKSFDETQEDRIDFHAALKSIAAKARIVILCASPPKIRDILLAAEELKMVSSGEYVFFNVELFTNLKKGYKPWHLENATEENNERAKRAYEALLTVTVRPPPDSDEYVKFDKEVKELALKKFNFSFDDEPVNPFVTAFYDAVILYATALNETLADGGSIDNGTEITRRMWNRSFQGITGNVSIDDNGDRNADYSLLDMDPESGVFHVVAHYSGKTKSIIEEDVKIHWPGGRTEAPPDTPKCGFDGSGCPTMPKYVIVVIALSSALVIMLISLFFIYRHYKLEAEIASMTWKVNIDDVLTTGGGNMGSRWSLASHRNSLISTGSGDSLLGSNKQLFVKTVFYKGSLVAFKKINKTRIELTRPLLLELKRMKDLHHEHLVRFIGASVDLPHYFLLTEYCPRGSLQDILENDQLKLDWTFRYSLMHDIVKAMHYLHNSEIRSHGNLKSSNCVVDSRFVLKVADFGLHSIRGVPEDAEDHNSYAYWRRKLWTAPELLRMENPPPEGTQKGDVYSFSIIVHEIAARKGSFHTYEEYTPEEIVAQLRDGQITRPDLEIDECDDELIELMKKWWTEDPIERPDFGQIKQSIRRLNKVNERGPTLVDNLLARMEQYANNLESLVQERTADYLEEKRKCEEVLYQLLPKSVAGNLIAGQTVNPETFDSVTIYFSDIVGFTSISAESSPMEVVTLLNDLYTCFDSIIEHFDVYKVETIGDAYMVVSGLPVRNGQAHAREIARMALALREAVLNFSIKHRPNEQLKLRIGMHTGLVAAGVVGQKMPRYCLFGDTVNTASRMESNGEALKIHVSKQTKEALDHFQTFILDPRGMIKVKGKGDMETFWLLGEREPRECVTATNINLNLNASAVAVNASNRGGTTNSFATSPSVDASPCTSPDNNCSREKPNICFDKDIPNSIVIDPAKYTKPKEHQDPNNISKGVSNNLIEV